MVTQTRLQNLGLVISAVLAMAALLGSIGSSPIEAAGRTYTLPRYEPGSYGVVYMYPYAPSEWDPGDMNAMTTTLQIAKNMGLDTIIQPFPAALIGTPNEGNWLNLLDAASEVGVQIVAYLWPYDAYTGDPDNPFDYSGIEAFISVIRNHPALKGYIGLHEPLEPARGISADELRGFYTHMKPLAPNAKIAHYMANIAYWEANRTDGWAFSDGMCDMCIVWYFPFRMQNGNPVYEQDLVPPVVQQNLALVAARDPDAELWFMGQTFAQAAHPRNLRMPTADEMRQLYLLVMQEPVDGFVWYPWQQTDVYDEILADPGNEQQQQQVVYVADHYVHLKKAYMPLMSSNK